MMPARSVDLGGASGVPGRAEAAVGVSLREAWNAQSERWIEWARAPHDSYWRFHRDRFLELVPDPGRLTLDIGAGEGRLSRELRRRGHSVVAIDGSPRLARACAGHDETVPTMVADAARLPVATGVSDLVVAFMSLHDVDDLGPAIDELARGLTSGGRLCLAIVHPINSAGSFEANGSDEEQPFVIRDSYFEHRRYAEEVERDGLTMRFESAHRPLETYTATLEHAGFVIEALREVTEPGPDDKWERVPLFLDLRAAKMRS